MNSLSKYVHAVMAALASIAGLSTCGVVLAADQLVDNTTIATVSVNGGGDTRNPGTTCLRITSPVAAACSASFVAIPNNNKQLIAAALAARTSSAKVWLYYDDAAPALHCPGQVFTPCSVISIEVK